MKKESMQLESKCSCLYVRYVFFIVVLIYCSRRGNYCVQYENVQCSLRIEGKDMAKNENKR